MLHQLLILIVTLFLSSSLYAQSVKDSYSDMVAGGMIGSGLAIEDAIDEEIKGNMPGQRLELPDGFYETIVQVSIPQSVDVDDVEEMDIFVFPNPTADYIFIRPSDLSDDFYGGIYDLFGNKLVEFMDQVFDDNYKIDVADLSPGSYIVRVVDSKDRAQEFKIIKH